MVQAISQFDLLEAVKRHGQRVVAVASAITLVCVFCAFWSWTPSWKDYELLGILPFWMPYVFILVRLYERRVESGLALAAAMGCALFLPGVFFFRFVLEWQRSWWIQTNLALALLMQPLLVAAAVWTFTSMGRAPRDLFKLRGSVGYGKVQGGVGYGILLFGLFWLLYSPIPRLISNNEADAEYQLRGICHRAFVGSRLQAKERGPECDFDHLRDLLSPPTHGYIFEYHSVVSEAPIPGCKVAKGYFLTARPVEFRKTGIRSFLVYRSNPDNPVLSEFYVRIHSTSEERPATVSDPVEEFELIEHRYGS
jgi:hypothetical protein